jgi:hypothetical protein
MDGSGIYMGTRSLTSNATTGAHFMETLWESSGKQCMIAGDNGIDAWA